MDWKNHFTNYNTSDKTEIQSQKTPRNDSDSPKIEKVELITKISSMNRLRVKSTNVL